MKTSLGGTCRGISWAAFLKRVSNLVQASARCSLCSCSDQGKQFRSALTLILGKEKNVTNIICRPVLHGVRTVDLSEIEGRAVKLQRFWVRAPKKNVVKIRPKKKLSKSINFFSPQAGKLNSKTIFQARFCDQSNPSGCNSKRKVP